MPTIFTRITSFIRRILTHGVLFGLLGGGFGLALVLFSPNGIAELRVPGAQEMIAVCGLMYFGMATVWIFIEEILLGRRIQRGPMEHDWLGVPDPCAVVSDGFPTEERY